MTRQEKIADMDAALAARRREIDLERWQLGNQPLLPFEPYMERLLIHAAKYNLGNNECLRQADAIARLAGSKIVTTEHFAEALMYEQADKEQQ